MNWRIASIGLAAFGGLALGETISMADAGYYTEDIIIPQAVVEGLLLLASIGCNDRYHQLRQRIGRNR